MNFSRMAEKLAHRFPSRIVTIDSHTAGEPTRLILGHENLPGRSMADKRLHLMENLDHIRLLMTREPRGHRNIFAALFTEPVTTGADFGLIYMDAKRYPYLCGHAVIGAVMTVIEMGMIPANEGIHPMIVDTPSGQVRAAATVNAGKVESVTIEMVPAFVQQTGCRLDLDEMGDSDGMGDSDEMGRIEVDLVCVGGFFAMVDVAQLGISLARENHGQLIEMGMAIIDAANRQLTINHPVRSDIQTVDVTEFYDTNSDENRHGRSVVIFGESHIDRSPCGTGTTAKMTLFHHKGLLDLNQPYINTSPLGTTFKGQLIEKTRVGDIEAVVAEITGSAYITGVHEFVIDPRDPFPDGYLL